MDYLKKLYDIIVNAPKTMLILIGIGILILFLTCCKSEAPNEDIYNLMDFPITQDSIKVDSTQIDSTDLDSLGDLKPNNLVRLVVHATASNVQTPYTRESLLYFFSTVQKWSKPGYTFFIDRKGILWKLNEHWDWDPVIEYSEITFGAKGFNSTSLHVAWDGGVANNKIVDNRTQEQKIALRTFVHIVKDIYPKIEVMGHRDLPNVHKACPVFDVKKEYADILGTL